MTRCLLAALAAFFVITPPAHASFDAAFESAGLQAIAGAIALMVLLLRGRLARRVSRVHRRKAAPRNTARPGGGTGL
jgi:hypothetical protein